MTYDRDMKSMRDFDLKFGAPDNEYGRNVIVRALSSLEAGIKIIEGQLIPPGYVAHSLVDMADRSAKKRG